MIGPADLTVVLPTRNESHNIARFLRSLPDDINLIVIDSSTDDTVARINELRPALTKVVVAEANIPQARQLGADLATTPWLLFTDADVILHPEYAERLSRVELPPNTGGVVGVKGTTGAHLAYHRWFRRGQWALDAAGIPAATGSNMLVRTEVLRQVGGFDPALSVNEDTELMFRIKRAGYRVPFVPELEVWSFDHRRIESGAGIKWLHSVTRGLMLLAAPKSQLVRSSDWGYWRNRTRDLLTR